MRPYILGGLLCCCLLAAGSAAAGKTPARPPLKIAAQTTAAKGDAKPDAKDDDKKPAGPLNFGGGNGPLEITADKSLEWHQQEHKYLARGAATATRGDVT